MHAAAVSRPLSPHLQQAKGVWPVNTGCVYYFLIQVNVSPAAAKGSVDVTFDVQCHKGYVVKCT